MNQKETIQAKLSTLVSLAEKFQLHEHIDRVEQQKRDINEPLLIMIVGKGNFGKSTLINALVGAEVAPVSIKPKTWKVDLYQNTQGEEYAELTWSDRPHEPVQCSIAEAESICEEQENIAKQKKREQQTWKSNLLQVRWFRNMAWPTSQEVVLVDTPGFSQERSDIQVEKFYIHGSQGFQIETNDPFEYYYNRSEIVLWCVKATNLEDQSTKESMEKVCSQSKTREIIGLLTFADRIPDQDKERIRLRALEIFGIWVKEFFYVSAGGSGDAKEQSIISLRERMERDFLTNAITYKFAQKSKQFEDEAAHVLLPIDTFMDFSASNRHLSESVRLQGITQMERTIQDMYNVHQRNWEKLQEKAKNNIVLFWSNSNGDPQVFQKQMKAESYKWDEVNRKNNDVIEETQRRLQVICNSLFSQLRWKGASVGKSGLSVQQMQASFVLGQIHLQKDIHFNFELSGTEGWDQGALAGVAGAVVGGLVLGPVGAMIGGALSAWLGGSSGRESAIKSKANEAIESCANHYKSAVHDKIKELVEKTKHMFQNELERSFQTHHGRNIDGIFSLATETDSLLAQLNYTPPNRLVYWNAHQPQFWSFYKPLFLPFFSHQANAWDSKVENKLQDSFSNYTRQVEGEISKWRTACTKQIAMLEVIDPQFDFQSSLRLKELLFEQASNLPEFPSSFLSFLPYLIFSNKRYGLERFEEILKQKRHSFFTRLKNDQKDFQERWEKVLIALCWKATLLNHREQLFSIFDTLTESFPATIKPRLSEIFMKYHIERLAAPGLVKNIWSILSEADIPRQFNSQLQTLSLRLLSEIKATCQETISPIAEEKKIEFTKKTVTDRVCASIEKAAQEKRMNHSYTFHDTPSNGSIPAWIVLVFVGLPLFFYDFPTAGLFFTLPTSIYLFIYYIRMHSLRENILVDATKLLQQYFAGVKQDLKDELEKKEYTDALKLLEREAQSLGINKLVVASTPFKTLSSTKQPSEINKLVVAATQEVLDRLSQDLEKVLTEQTQANSNKKKEEEQ